MLFSKEWQTPGSAPPFVPNWYINITATLPIKLKSLQEYQNELRNWPHAQSIPSLEYLARWRGANIGCAAEAFILGKKYNSINNDME
ncbi:hypothetical protein [Halalkalibacter flavus]|uniref:hypothetical protein n=1 Tax=Halalkalibacter flavus TaxID=3090668 RepID=UPI002FC629DB